MKYVNIHTLIRPNSRSIRTHLHNITIFSLSLFFNKHRPVHVLDVIYWHLTLMSEILKHTHAHSSELGDSGGVVNSLDFCPASLKSVPWLILLPVCTFFTVEGGDSEFANFTLPTLKAFFEAQS